MRTLLLVLLGVVALVGVLVWVSDRWLGRESPAPPEAPVVPRHELTLRLAAQAAMELGQLDESLALWERLLRVNRHFPEGLFFQARLLARTGRHAQSVEACRKLLVLTPTRAEPWIVLTHCYAKLGAAARTREARRMAEALKTPRSEEFRTSFLRSVK